MQRRRFLALLGVAPVALVAPRPLGPSTDLSPLFLSTKFAGGADLDVEAFHAFIDDWKQALRMESLRRLNGGFCIVCGLPRRGLNACRAGFRRGGRLNAGHAGKAAAARSA